MSRESVDVFSFLVEEDSQDTPTMHADKLSVPGPDAMPITEESDTESVIRSPHSDSGISMGDNSVCLPVGDALLDARLPPLPEDTQENTNAQGPLRDRPTFPRRLRWKWPDIPPATHKDHVPSPPIRTPSPEHIRVRIPRMPDELGPRFCFPEQKLSGYDLIADKLSQGELPQVFRQFKRINFRVLLQLQDEITEMEEELTSLDLADTRNRLNPDGSTSPASRRINWRWSQSDLQAHRLQVLGRLYIKIEQYCKTILH